MDITTLAAANAYTDKKVAEGGGGGGGLPVVELTTTLSHGATLTAEENAALTAAFDRGAPCSMKFVVEADNQVYTITSAFPLMMGMGGIKMIIIQMSDQMLQFFSMDSPTWTVQIG